MTFSVGDKVICINGSRNNYYIEYVAGEIFTVEEISKDEFGSMFRLKRLYGQYLSGGHWIQPNNFRKAKEEEIECFKDRFSKVVNHIMEFIGNDEYYMDEIEKGIMKGKGFLSINGIIYAGIPSEILFYIVRSNQFNIDEAFFNEKAMVRIKK